MQVQPSTFIPELFELIRKNDGIDGNLKTMAYVPMVGIISGGFRALFGIIQLIISIAKIKFNIGKKSENQKQLDLSKKKISRGLNEMVPLRMLFGDLKDLREEKAAVQKEAEAAAAVKIQSIIRMQSLVRMSQAKQEVQKLRKKEADKQSLAKLKQEEKEMEAAAKLLKEQKPQSVESSFFSTVAKTFLENQDGDGGFNTFGIIDY